MPVERTYTEAELQRRLKDAQAIGRDRAWRDLTRRLTLGQRLQLANDMAHDFTITAIEVEDRYGNRARRIEGGITREAAIKTMDEDRNKARAARTDGVTATPGETK